MAHLRRYPRLTGVVACALLAACQDPGPDRGPDADTDVGIDPGGFPDEVGATDPGGPGDDGPDVLCPPRHDAFTYDCSGSALSVVSPVGGEHGLRMCARPGETATLQVELAVHPCWESGCSWCRLEGVEVWHENGSGGRVPADPSVIQASLPARTDGTPQVGGEYTFNDRIVVELAFHPTTASPLEIFSGDPIPDAVSVDVRVDCRSYHDGDTADIRVSLVARADGLCGPEGPHGVVVSHPYDAKGAKSEAWEVLSLAPDGTLSQTGQTFQMGRMTGGSVDFRDDGAVGVAVSEDGTLGIFRMDDKGAASVVEKGWADGFYAGAATFLEDGSLVVLDPNWANNGGGVFTVDVAADGTPSGATREFASKLASSFLPVPLKPGRAVLVAQDVLGSPAGADVHLLAWGGTPQRLSSASAFGDDLAIVSGAAATADGRFVLVGDNSEFSGLPNRVAVLELTGDTVVARSVLSPVDDPVAFVSSPYNNGILVASGYGNALLLIEYSVPGVPSAVFPLSPNGKKPQLPAGLVVLRRGELRGMVLAAENLGVRRLRWHAPNTISNLDDLGLFSLGEGLDRIVGAVGIQP